MVVCKLRLVFKGGKKDKYEQYEAKSIEKAHEKAFEEYKPNLLASVLAGTKRI